MEKKIIDKIFFMRPTYIMMKVDGKKCVSKIAKEVNTTYSHTVKVMKYLEELGLVVAQRVGRERKTTTTEKGEKLRLHLLKVNELLKNG